MAEEMMLLYEMLDESIEEELLNEDEGDIHLIGAIIPFMRRDLIRNVFFFEVVEPCYSLDEFFTTWEADLSQRPGTSET